MGSVRNGGVWSMVSQSRPESKADEKRVPKTPRYYKSRKLRRATVMSKQVFAESERLSPSEQRVFELMKLESPWGTFCLSQDETSKKLAIHLNTSKIAFRSLIKKRYIAKPRNNVYVINPERFYTGDEEMFAKAVADFAEIASAGRRKAISAIHKREMTGREQIAAFDAVCENNQGAVG